MYTISNNALLAAERKAKSPKIISKEMEVYSPTVRSLFANAIKIQLISAIVGCDDVKPISFGESVYFQ